MIWTLYFKFHVALTAKLDRDVASDEKMLFTKSHNLFVMLTHKVICQRKDIIPPILRDL